MTFDSNGALYAADTGNARIQTITGGIVSTVDGRRLYLADSGNDLIRVIDLQY